MKAGWTTEPLNSNIKFVDYRGNTPPKRPEGIRLITAKNVKMGVINRAPEEFMEPAAYDGWMTRGFPSKGDVLFTTEAPLGNVAQLDTSERVVIGQRLITMQPNKSLIDQSFLCYALMSPQMQEEIHSRATGATVLGIKSKLLKMIPFSYPTLEEQKRIVAVLDGAFDALTRARAHVEANLLNARELFDCALNRIFHNNTGQKLVALEDCLEIVSGNSFSSRDFSPDNQLNSIKITNVGVREFVCNKSAKLPEGFADEYKRFSIPAGSIVIALTRSVIAGGLKVAIVPKAFDGALLNQRVAALKVSGDESLRNYIYSFLCSSIVSDYVLENVNTLMQPNLSITDLRKLRVPIPSDADIVSTVKKLKLLSAQSQKLTTLYSADLDALDDLRQSLLQKAFSGELT